MAAPTGNQFWRLADQPGRPKTFETPADLWERSCEYFEWCDNNPLMSYEWNGKDPQKCELEKMRPYTWTGLEVYLNADLTRYRANEHEEFVEIVTRIGKIIYTQKFEGAACGLLNPNIIARDLGLTDKQEQAVSVSAGDPETLKAIAARMNG